MNWDMRRKLHKDVVHTLWLQMKIEQNSKLMEYFRNLWREEQDLKDIELLSLLHETELG